MSENNSIPDDGLITPDVGPWSEQKYELLQNYANIFARATKKKWQSRVYLDLFSGAGRSLIKGSSRIVPASPILAIEIKDRFDVYIFCEEDEKKLNALKHRVKTTYPQIDAKYLLGDINQIVDKIFTEMPPFKKDHKVITFCFADPYNIKSLHFDTIRKLSERRMDFLILLATDMDAKRNIHNYISPYNENLDMFFGTPNWRIEWEKTKLNNVKFDIFLVNFFRNQMGQLGYIFSEQDNSILIRAEKNLPLYRLGFFSRHPLGQKFWEEAKKYSTDQTNLFD